MKKHMIFAALAALCLTACNEEKKDSSQEVTTAAQTTAVTLETIAAEQSSGVTAVTTVPQITQKAETAVTVAVTSETADGKITVTMPAVTTAPLFSVINDPPAVPFPDSMNIQLGEDSLRISPKDAARLDLQRLQGEWSYLPLKGMPYAVGLSGMSEDDRESPLEIHVAEDGAFSAYILERWTTPKLIANGKVTVKNERYVFRCDNGSEMLSAYPDPEEPLNTLCVNGSDETRFSRYTDGVLLYDRQYRRAEQAPQGERSGVRVSTLAGFSWEFKSSEFDSYRFRVYDADEMSGSFEFSFEAYMHPDTLHTTGKVFLEQGLDNAGELRYYYNFYDEADGKERLILSLEAENMITDAGDTRMIALTECYHFFAGGQVGTGKARFCALPENAS
ncbi:MAG: hypothetical protein IK130_07755 [Oscillospiraceae bacterium]|nr:hypothetical protein [Oscillospiraceae bacterium]